MQDTVSFHSPCWWCLHNLRFFSLACVAIATILVAKCVSFINMGIIAFFSAGHVIFFGNAEALQCSPKRFRPELFFQSTPFTRSKLLAPHACLRYTQ